MQIPDELRADLTFQPYPPFPAVPALDVLLTWSREQVDAFEASHREVERQIAVVQRQHAQCVNAWADFLAALGVPTRNKSGKGAYLAPFLTFVKMLPKPNWTPASPLRDSRRPVISSSDGPVTVDGKTFQWSINRSPSTLWERLERARELLRREQDEDVRVMRAIDQGVKYGIQAGSYANMQAFVRAVEVVAREAAIAQQFPPGVTVEIPDSVCDCTIWTVGDDRCQCGSQRVSIECYGDLVNGYSAFVAAG